MSQGKVQERVEDKTGEGSWQPNFCIFKQSKYVFVTTMPLHIMSVVKCFCVAKCTVMLIREISLVAIECCTFFFFFFFY